MSLPEERSDSHFTDFEGRFRGRLSTVVPIRVPASKEGVGISARYECHVKAEYHRDLMGLLEEGILLAVRNFRSTSGSEEGERYTLMAVSRVWPEHFGLMGLSDHSYYPLQFEVIEQSVSDWKTDDRSTMMVQLSAIPINYDMILKDGGDPEYVKGFSYPIVGERAYILNADTINKMYNGRVLRKMGLSPKASRPDARSDPRLGVIKMFEALGERIPIYVDFESLVRYHFGIFAFTGGGKSNLLSNILRRIILHTFDTKVVVFDVSCEYPFLLMDALADGAIVSKVVLEAPVENADQLYETVVKPREYEGDERVRKGFELILRQGKVTHYVKPRQRVPTYGDFLGELEEQRKASLDKPHYINAIEDVQKAVWDYMQARGLSESQELDEEFVSIIDARATEAVKRFRVHESSGLFAWATTRSAIRDLIRLRKKEEGEEKGLTAEGIREMIEGETRLVCLSISDPLTIKELVLDLTQEVLQRRKRRFKVKPYILFVFDEAQEFIPAPDSASGIDKKCSQGVETLLRQGRKYGLGGCVATQRIAYLNTNALQQLHTYFVGTLPRPYDRGLVSDTFMIDQGILEKTLEFAPGEWLLSSYIATGIENVPIFIKADNAEEELEKFLRCL